ncbi:hypothetical protein D1B31_16545 [Neobacillus notoginsengisoli]|uniref:HD family phosphohydrolase n=1 Tax=Neobacillus notoginsengisoli TaxID=1578198 RepID=A0A417YRL5_9BACI|nr:hypothetical protein [Neobacillus notoginsengisoli]RHW37369.1 hypothetical protein D1B31_16545 [Neobacillus notoginsengisoli]
MGWLIAGGFYLLQFIGVIVVILLGYFIYDKRYKKDLNGAVPPGFVATSEVNIDPVTGEKERVYYNPETGERYYRKER